MGELIDRRRVRSVKKLKDRFEEIHRFGLNAGEILEELKFLLNQLGQLDLIARLAQIGCSGLVGR